MSGNLQWISEMEDLEEQLVELRGTLHGWSEGNSEK